MDAIAYILDSLGILQVTQLYISAMFTVALIFFIFKR